MAVRVQTAYVPSMVVLVAVASCSRPAEGHACFFLVQVQGTTDEGKPSGESSQFYSAPSKSSSSEGPAARADGLNGRTGLTKTVRPSIRTYGGATHRLQDMRRGGGQISMWKLNGLCHRLSPFYFLGTKRLPARQHRGFAEFPGGKTMFSRVRKSARPCTNSKEATWPLDMRLLHWRGCGMARHGDFVEAPKPKNEFVTFHRPDRLCTTMTDSVLRHTADTAGTCIQPG